jgi:Leucine-rich repeat (LRR) protein
MTIFAFVKAIDVLLFTTLLSGCALRTGSEAFLAPEIVQADAVVVNQEVRLRCSLSAGRAERCGFFYGPAEEELQEVPCLLEGTSFELQINHLTPGQTYEWYAYASAGENEIRSEKLRFSIDSLPPGSVITIPDPVFREYLLQRYDGDADGAISLGEAENITEIYINTDNVHSLCGIEQMPNLTTLGCRNSDDYGRGGLTELDVSGNPKLTYLDCSYNRLRHLDVKNLRNLTSLHCNHNLLEELDITANLKLCILCANSNRLTAIDVSGNPLLTDLHVDENRIGTLDLSHNLKLKVDDTYLSPMEDERGNNLLKTLYLDKRQSALSVRAPKETQIIYL